MLAPFGQDAAAAQAALLDAVREAMATAFANTFWVAALLVALTLVPALFMPRRHEESHLLDDASETASPIVMH